MARRNDGAWLLERRPSKGLLGGMLGWPGSEWAEELASSEPPIAGDWVKVNSVVRHTFTHFHLELSVQVAQDALGEPKTGAFMSKEEFSQSDLPTLMRKVFDTALPSLGQV